MLIGAPERYRPPERSTLNPRAGHRHRTRYLLCGLLAVPVLIIGGLWAARGASPGAVPVSALGATASSRSVASAAVTARPEACAPAVAVACAPSPVHVSLARVPARRGMRWSAAGGLRPARASARGAPAGPPIAPSGSPGSTAAGLGTATPSACPPALPSGGAGWPSGQPSGQPTGQPSGQPGSAADQVLALINHARSAAGLPPLTVIAGLVASASAHDLRMAGGCGLTHQCPGEPAIGARETAAGVDWTGAGENIGDGRPVPDTTAAMAQMAVTLTQDMLDEQPPDDGHRLNILSAAFAHIGIAVYRDGAGTVWLTQDFCD